MSPQENSIRKAFQFLIFYFGSIIIGILVVYTQIAFELREILATIFLITASFFNGVHDAWLIRKAGVGDGSWHATKTLFFFLMAGFIIVYGYLDKEPEYLTMGLMSAICFLVWRIGHILGNRYKFSW